MLIDAFLQWSRSFTNIVSAAFTARNLVHAGFFGGDLSASVAVENLSEGA